MREVTPEVITSLESNEVFVFGSNTAGKHVGGAARIAYLNFGAVYGEGIGIFGQSYALPTMDGAFDCLRIKEIQRHVDHFLGVAEQHPELKFYVTKIGTGIAGFKVEEIAQLFYDTDIPDNVILPEEFLQPTDL